MTLSMDDFPVGVRVRMTGRWSSVHLHMDSWRGTVTATHRRPNDRGYVTVRWDEGVDSNAYPIKPDTMGMELFEITPVAWDVPPARSREAIEQWIDA